MQLNKFDNASIIGVDVCTRERKGALRDLHRAEVQPTAGASRGRGSDVARSDPRSVHALLNGKASLRAALWSLYSRVYLVVVPGADLERAMYSLHCMHYTITLLWLGCLVAAQVMIDNIEKRGLTAIAKTAATTGSYFPSP